MDDDDRIFEEEMRKIEEKMGKGCIESTNNNPIKAKKRKMKVLSKELESIIENQIFGEKSEDVEDFPINITENKLEEHDVMGFKKFKDCVMSYKKDSKNFFLGELLGQCLKKRKTCDKWYPWSKEMLEKVDLNEEIMRKGLIEYGHEEISNLFEKHSKELSEKKKRLIEDSWNLSINEKISNLIEGLKSIEDCIKTDGMNTIWGTIKFQGVIFNNIKGTMDQFMKMTNRRYDIIDYVKYKEKKWEDHYEKVKDENERKSLYF